MKSDPINSEASDELIVARATAPGAAAVAIVRLDGRGADVAMNVLFRPAGKRSPAEQPRRMLFGYWQEPESGEAIDDGMTVFFPAPHSYTGNDLVEFHCHGGAVPARRLIDAALAVGARPADPGEFTRRAFLNGQIDLAQAEAVADLINAQTDAAARLARAQLAGALSERIGAAREAAITLAAEIEARIDFPDEEIEAADRARLQKLFDTIALEIDQLLATRRRGKLLREGARVALVGRPNAGKSSLLNALARRERAIVTPHPGTTRDTIECTIDLDGVPVILVDTAGLRESDDPIERIGIERARSEIEQADIVIEVIDATESVRETALTVGKPDLVLMNKSDLIDEKLNAGDRLFVSATRGDGLKELEEALLGKLMGEGRGSGDGDLAVSARHSELLARGAKALANARASFEQNLSGEFTMVDMRETLDCLSQVLGLETGDAVLDRVFSKFCIGK